eukprot:scaffold90296_cov68-Phaeocystis_antarctica.AAC.12
MTRKIRKQIVALKIRKIRKRTVSLIEPCRSTELNCTRVRRTVPSLSNSASNVPGTLTASVYQPRAVSVRTVPERIVSNRVGV